MTKSPDSSANLQQTNEMAAVRFIHGFNDDDWDTVREVVAPGFVFHHPLGGTVEAGPEGMVSTWAGFKQLSPDSWHPIPIMIADDDYVAVLLPTYGTFTGQGEHAPPPTGGRLDYGMVNMVRLEDGQLAEIWFGMDSLVEMQQMGVAPTPPPVELSPAAQANLAAFHDTVGADAGPLDNLAAFDDVVVALGPPQNDRAATNRRVDIYRFDDSTPVKIYEHALVTDPPYGGDPEIDTEASRDVVERWIDQAINRHDPTTIGALAAPHVLIHATAMPCEATYHGPAGATAWLQTQWDSFEDLTVTDHHSVARGDIVAVRWTARGTSSGPLMGLPPTGGTVEFTGVSMYRIEHGSVAEIWDTRNTLGILHQLNPELGAGGHHH
ncbi:MAG: ester cyclase [Acidimicrobiia bacterium]|nr:ester cyclase [Acidimicrobiia bacterium]